MIQLRGNFRFSLEPFCVDRVLQNLDGDFALTQTVVDSSIECALTSFGKSPASYAVLAGDDMTLS